ncbi:hypothetical protein QJS10_CPA08g01226 [Acorus calamus]|uniref:AP2/ERF domain-containing protein n=1 Tax=Acorus calamus TaxID=4465 RepID=A0AAV9E793_ACOCL|nr:hypothetical protein QJS10_CPA08g01226 [Acorus calamus]
MPSRNAVAAATTETPPTRHFKGVRRRSWGRYVSEIRLPRKNVRIWLGSFDSAESAARAHDSASLFLHNDPSALNFPDSAESLPRPDSASPRAIRAAAAKAAETPGRARHEPGTSFFEDERDAPLHSPVRIDGLLGLFDSALCDARFAPLDFQSTSGWWNTWEF